MNKFIKSLIVLCTLSMTAQTFTMSADIVAPITAEITQAAAPIATQVAQSVATSGLSGGLKDGNLSINVNFSQILKTLAYLPKNIVDVLYQYPRTTLTATLALGGLYMWHRLDAKRHHEEACADINTQIVTLCGSIEQLNVGDNISNVIRAQIQFVANYIKKTFGNPWYSKFLYFSRYISKEEKNSYAHEASKYAQQLVNAATNETTITESMKTAAFGLSRIFISSIG